MNNKQTLLDLKAKAELRFTQVQAEANAAQAQAEELNKELLRIQGEYRSLEAMLEIIEKEEANSPAGPTAPVDDIKGSK